MRECENRMSELDKKDLGAKTLLLHKKKTNDISFLKQPILTSFFSKTDVNIVKLTSVFSKPVLSSSFYLRICHIFVNISFIKVNVVILKLFFLVV